MIASKVMMMRGGMVVGFMMGRETVVMRGVWRWSRLLITRCSVRGRYYVAVAICDKAAAHAVPVRVERLWRGTNTYTLRCVRLFCVCMCL